MSNYLIYRNGHNELTRTVQHVPVQTLIHVSFEEADRRLMELKSEHPQDVFQLVSAQFKTGCGSHKLNKYVRRGGEIVKNRVNSPVGKVNRFCLIHNVKTVKVV